MISFWNDKKVLVTGATGLVGSWLVKALLAQRAQVVAFVRDANPQSDFFHTGDYQKTTIVQGALEDYLSIERAINEYEIDTVFHLGAQTIVGTAVRNPLSTFESNIRGSYNLLEACRRHSNFVQRIVIASSDKAYGFSPILPYVETLPLQGRHPYDVSKSCTDLIAHCYHHTYGLPLAVARCGNIYGGGDLNFSRLIPGTIKSLISDQPPVIRSDGNFTRDYLYVEDICSAYLLLAEQLHRPEIGGEAFNFGLDNPYSALQVVTRIQKLMDCAHLHPHILNQGSAEIRNQSLDSTKSKTILGWEPSYTLEEGLVPTIEWYRHFLGERCLTS